MALELTNFEVVLHICILLNFLYAVSNEFSEKVFPLLKSPFRDNFQKRLTKCSAIIAKLETTIGEDMTIPFKLPFIKLSEQIKDFNDGNGKDYDLGPKFKCLYLLGGLYGFLLLLLAGFNYYLVDKNNFYCTIFYSNIIFSIFSLVVIISTFVTKKTVKGAWALLTFLFIVIFQLISYNSIPNHHLHCFFQSSNKCMTDESTMTIFCVILVLSPFILHILRATYELLINYFGIRSNLNKFQSALKTIVAGNPPTAPSNAVARKQQILDQYKTSIDLLNPPTSTKSNFD